MLDGFRAIRSSSAGAWPVREQEVPHLCYDERWPRSRQQGKAATKSS